MTQIDHIGDDIYRFCTLPASSSYDVGFNQFLIHDERPALIHTGYYDSFADVRRAVAEIMDPAKLEYIVILHFEADECGGMGRFLAEAPQAVLVCAEISAALNVSHWDHAGPIQGVRDGHMIDLGTHKLRFLETPHVHHWDSMMVFEDTTGSLFSSDLFIQPGDQPAIVREDLSQEMCTVYREAGIFAAEEPVRRVVNRLEQLEANWIHPMHGGSLPREVLPKYVRALREEPFAYNGKLFGRTLPT